MARKKKLNNAQFIKAMMEGRNDTVRVNPALVHMFVMNAVTEHANKYAALTPEQIKKAFDNTMVCGEAWVEAAKQIKVALEEFYKD